MISQRDIIVFRRFSKGKLTKTTFLLENHDIPKKTFFFFEKVVDLLFCCSYLAVLININKYKRPKCVFRYRKSSSELCAHCFIEEYGHNQPLPGLDAMQGWDFETLRTKVVKHVSLPSFTLALACCQQDAGDKGLLLMSHLLCRVSLLFCIGRRSTSTMHW